MKIKPNFFLIVILIIGFHFNGISQDTITVFLDSDFASTEIENAKYIRKVIIINNHYHVTDKEVNGSMVNYGEYKSVNPWIEDGISKHFDNNGKVYSYGRYLNGDLIGQWIYYNNGKSDTVNYDIDLTSDQLNDCNRNKKPKNKKKLNQISQVHIDLITNYVHSNFHLPARTKSQINNFYQVINLTLDIDGKIKCPEIVNFIDRDLSLEVLRILLQYKSKTEITSPLPLQLTIDFEEERKDHSDEVFTIVEDMPMFKYQDCSTTGECLRHYISDSLRLPTGDCSGRVIVHFVVEPDGNVINVTILKGINNCIGYVEEIERLFKTMPAWIPGKQRGKAVRVAYNTSINFNE